VIDQHVDGSIIEIPVGPFVPADPDEFVDLADTDPPGHQRLTNLRKVPTYARQTHLCPGDVRGLVTSRPQIRLHGRVTIQCRRLARLGGGSNRQPTSVQRTGGELESFDLGIERNGAPLDVLGEHVPEHEPILIEHTFD